MAPLINDSDPKHVETNTNIKVPTESPPVIPNFSKVPTLNLRKLSGPEIRNREQSSEDSCLSAIRANNRISEQWLTTTGDYFNRPPHCWNFQLPASALGFGVKHCGTTEQIRTTSQTLEIRGRQQKEFWKKAKQLLELNTLLGLPLKELKDKEKVLLAKLDDKNN